MTDQRQRSRSIMVHINRNEGVWIKNLPATFRRAVDIIFSFVKRQYALVYLDDTITVSTSITKQLLHLDTILRMSVKAGRKPKLKKCFFLQVAVDCVGHVVYSRKLSVASKTVNAIQSMTHPKKVVELRSFPELCSFYHRFVQNFFRISNLLNRIPRNGESTNFKSLADSSMDVFESL